MKEAKKKKRNRYPRPQGITYLCQEYNHNQQNKKELYTKIQNKYIRAILNQELLIYDRNTKALRLLNLKDLALLLNTKEEYLLIQLAREMDRVGTIIDNKKGDWARGMIFQSLFWASETRALTYAQTNTLLRAQGNKFVPFLTSEVNKSIANLIASNKPLNDILRLLIPTNNPNQILPANEQSEDGQSTQSQQYLSTDSAIKLLNERANNLLTNSTDFEVIKSTLGTLPEVNPNLQGGNILDSKSLLKDMPDDLKTVTREERTTKRRGIEELEDEEDFIA